MAAFAAACSFAVDNDNLADAIVLSGETGTLNASNEGATIEEGESALSASSACYAQANPLATIWYKWTATANGEMQIDTLGSDFDTVLSVYTGSGFDNLTEVVWDDDALDGDVRVNQSSVSFRTTVGVTYYIMVAGYADNAGSVVLNWDFFVGTFRMTVNNDGVVTGYRGICPAQLDADSWPSSATSVTNGVFSDVAEIESVFVPADVVEIGEEAFARCANLTNVTFGAGGEASVDVAYNAFAGTPYEAGKPFSLIIDGNGALLGFHGTAPETLVISNYLNGLTLTDIGTEALSAAVWAADSLKSVFVPEGVTYLDSDAFAGDEALESVDLPLSLRYVYTGAFQGCTALRTLTIPKGVRLVEDAFTDCEDLTVHAPSTLEDEIAVPDGCKVDYYDVVVYTVTLDANGGEFEWEGVDVSDADMSCVEGLPIDNLPTPWLDGYDFVGWFTAADGGVEVSESTVVTDDMTVYAHWEAPAPEWDFEIDGGSAVLLGSFNELIGDIVIPASVTIEEDDGHGGVMEVNYAVTEIYKSAFSGMDLISSVTIPASVTNISDWAFQDCQNLDTVVFDGGMASIKMNVFSAFAGTPWIDAYTASLPAPDNDDFADAIEISGDSGQVSGTSAAATAEADEDCLGDENCGTVWWKWTANEDCAVAFETLGSNFDTTLGVYVGNAVDDLKGIADNDDYYADYTSRVEFDATAGTTYYIAVGGYSMGSIVLSWATGSELIPEIAADADAATVNATVDGIGFADANVKTVIGGSATEYLAFREWAQTVGEDDVVDGDHSSASYLLGAGYVFDNEPTIEIGDLAIGEMQPGVAGMRQMTFSVTVSDGDYAASFDADKVAAMVEATVDPGDWSGPAKFLPTVQVVENGSTGTAVYSASFGSEPRAFLRIRK